MQSEEVREKNGALVQSEIETTEERDGSALDRRTIWILTVACGLAVGNLYYIQPLLAEIAQTFSISESTAGLIATLQQFGYALGLLLLVPLGDALNRRKLITRLLLIVAFMLLGNALAPNAGFLTIVCFGLGITTIVPQLIVPFAASLARPQERGQVVGTVMSGLLIGILLARIVSGFVGAHLGWRTMYWIAAALMFVLSIVLRLILPQDQPREPIRYSMLLRSLWGLLRTQPVIREVSLFGAVAFGGFSAFWVTLVFFLQASYHYGSDVAGLFGLVGIVGALAATFAGKLADRVDARITTGFMLLVILLSFVVFWLFGQLLWGLILGVILLDLGMQGAHISNQTRVYSLNPAARNRLNTIYMTSYFTGGSLGSALGAVAWSMFGWNGVCALGIGFLLLALGIYVIRSRTAMF